MPKKRNEEDYCEDCGELLDDCECEEYEEEDELTLDDLNKGLDTLNKGLDVYAKFKKITTPQQSPPPPKPLSDDEAKWISQEIVRKQKINTSKKVEKTEEEKKKHRKWIIETIIKIAVPITVALIAVRFFLF